MTETRTVHTDELIGRLSREETYGAFSEHVSSGKARFFQQAIRLVLDVNSQRQAARHAGVSHGTVANWFKQYADDLPDELPGTGIAVDVAEQDELFTFIGQKKTGSTS